MSQQSTDATDRVQSTDDETVLLRTQPTVRPVLIRLVATLLVGAVAIGVLFAAPQLLGSTENTNVALVVVQAVVAIAAARLVVKIIVLRATEYVITDRSVRRRFQLLARTKAREVPYDLVRSHEHSQNRVEYLLGYGSISLNQGLGDLRLEMLANHEEVYERVRRRVEAAS